MLAGPLTDLLARDSRRVGEGRAVPPRGESTLWSAETRFDAVLKVAA